MKRILLPILFLAIFLTSCYDEWDEKNIFDPEIYRVYILPKVEEDSIFADGRSTTNLFVRIPVETEPDKRIVTFTTNIGSFPDGTDKTITLQIDSIDTADRSKRVAKFRLRSNQSEGVAAIVTKYLGVAQTPVHVRFIKAYPDGGYVEADRFSISSSYNSEAVVTAVLTRSRGGRPSIGQKVQFVVVDSGGMERVLYRAANLTSNEEGKTSVTIAINDTTFVGKLFIKAKFSNGPGKDTIIFNTLIVTP